MVFLNYDKLISSVTEMSFEASDAVRKIQLRGSQNRFKRDHSVVTNGDIASEKIILSQLRKLTPHIPVFSEEELYSNPNQLIPKTLWLVDPIDGTNGYSRGEPNYAICVALVENGRATLGVIACPSYHTVHVGCVRDHHAHVTDVSGVQTDIHVRKIDPHNVISVHGAQSQPVTFMNYENVTQIKISSAVKFCMVADGRADIYVRNALLNEYDIAAGDALVHAAGGRMTDIRNCVITYGNQGLLSPAFIAQGAD